MELPALVQVELERSLRNGWKAESSNQGLRGQSSQRQAVRAWAATEGCGPYRGTVEIVSGGGKALIACLGRMLSLRRVPGGQPSFRTHRPVRARWLESGEDPTWDR
jgi:hypothetical protein